MKAVYIHLPFCSNICSYCDFCKVFYNEKIVNQYLMALEKEIQTNYRGEMIETIYIGGGTPTSLSVEQLKQLFRIIEVFKKGLNYEFTIECNVEDTGTEKLILFKDKGVNRLSIGVQSFNEDNLKLLGRKHTKQQVGDLVLTAQKLGFNNISIDLIYGLPGQTLMALKKEIEEALKLKVNHISSYSLIIEEHTIFNNQGIKNIDPDLEYEMYQYLCDKLEDSGYQHYEISNFGKNGFWSKHNLVYWNNDNYYGFGAGASGYIDDTRYDNTRSINNYINGEYRLHCEKLTKEHMMENELILGLRKIEGVDTDSFYQRYKVHLEDFLVIKNMLKDKYLIKSGKIVSVNQKYLYVSNEILIKLLGGFDDGRQANTN